MKLILRKRLKKNYFSFHLTKLGPLLFNSNIKKSKKTLVYQTVKKNTISAEMMMLISKLLKILTSIKFFIDIFSQRHSSKLTK